MEEKYCPNCKHPLHTDAHFCPACMTVLEPGAEVTVPKPKGLVRWWVAVVCIIAFIPLGIGYVVHQAIPSETPPENVSLWVMKLRPNGGTDSFAFCQEQEIVGFGWGLKGTPATIPEYRQMREAEGAYPGDKLLDQTLDYFESMTSKGYINLVWTQDKVGNYYLCEITGDYQYSRDERHEQAGIVNFTPCKFYSVGRDLVPQAVTEAMSTSGVIDFVRDGVAVETTRELWMIAGENH